VHPIEPYPYGYTVGLTERGWPELIIVGNSPNPLAEIKSEMAARGVDPDPDLEECIGSYLMDSFMRKLDALARYQARRGRPLQAGEHVHGHDVKGLDCCVELAEMPPPDRRRFSMASADQRYGENGYTALHVVMWGPDEKLQTDPACEITVPPMLDHFDA
jgi:hypothetical protein